MPSKDLENSIKFLFQQWAQEKLVEEQSMKKVRYAGPVFGVDEYQGMLDAVFSGWWSNGSHTLKAERKVAEMCDRKHALLFNSGSTANLALMLACMHRYFQPGDKILTLACGFPTTLNPIIHAGLVPVFCDISMEDLSVPDVSLDEIRGIFIPHTLGFAGNVDKLLDQAREKDIVVLYDACDAYGSEYNGRPLASYGKAATLSFYVAHHLSCGEGGAIVTNDTELFLIARGIRNWGRYCASSECCVRSTNPEAFCTNVKYTKNSDVPDDYMANYQFEWPGYNFKMLDLQAAMLSAQIPRLDQFTAVRRRNYTEIFFALNEAAKNHDIVTWGLDKGCSPFSVPFVLKDTKKHSRYHFMEFLQKNKVESRMIFAGNLLRHPAYSYLNEVGDFPNSDLLMEKGIMLGCSHVIDSDKCGRISTLIKEFFS